MTIQMWPKDDIQSIAVLRGMLWNEAPMQSTLHVELRILQNFNWAIKPIEIFCRANYNLYEIEGSFPQIP